MLSLALSVSPSLAAAALAPSITNAAPKFPSLFISFKQKTALDCCKFFCVCQAVVCVCPASIIFGFFADSPTPSFRTANSATDHNSSNVTITLALGSDDGAPQATCAEKDLPDILVELGQDESEVADSLGGDTNAFLTAIKEEVELIATIEEQSEAFSLAAIEFKSAPSIAALGKLVRAQQKMLGEAFATMASSNMAKLYPVAQMKQALSLLDSEDLLAVTNVNIQNEAPTIHFNIEKGPSTLRKNATFSLSFIDDTRYLLTILPYIKNRQGDETEKETLDSSQSTVIGNKIRNVFSN